MSEQEPSNSNPDQVVRMLPQDNDSQQSILERIEKNEITDYEEIMRLVDESQFSSEHARQQTRLGMLYLFQKGALSPDKLRESKAREVRIEIQNIDGKPTV